jgi:hypothetical protein
MIAKVQQHGFRDDCDGTFVLGQGYVEGHPVSDAPTGRALPILHTLHPAITTTSTRRANQFFLSSPFDKNISVNTSGKSPL